MYPVGLQILQNDARSIQYQINTATSFSTTHKLLRKEKYRTSNFVFCVRNQVFKKTLRMLLKY